MSTLIFFGGLFTGFFVGFIAMAVLAMTSVKRREEEPAENPTYGECSCSPGSSTANC